MTVEEAKQKWCPKAVLVFNAPYYGSGNRFDSENQDSHNQCCCLGPDCMMWAGDDTQGECGLALNDRIIEIGDDGTSRFLESAKKGD